jgi:hypothetical protein
MRRDTLESEIDALPKERRSNRRYDVRLEARWKLLRRRRVLDQGACQTLDFSSGGILLAVDRAFPIGLSVELSIAWPVALDDRTPLQLAVAGRVVRSDNGRAAIRLTQYEFRTVAVRRVQPNSSWTSAPALSFGDRRLANGPGNSQSAFVRRPAPARS